MAEAQATPVTTVMVVSIGTLTSTGLAAAPLTKATKTSLVVISKGRSIRATIA